VQPKFDVGLFINGPKKQALKRKYNFFHCFVAKWKKFRLLTDEEP